MLWLLRPVIQNLHQCYDLDTELDLHRIMSGFHGASATGVACQQGAFTLPDTWFRPPLGTDLCSNCWDQIPRTCHVFNRIIPLNTPWYFLDFISLWQDLFCWYTCTTFWHHNLDFNLRPHFENKKELLFQIYFITSNHYHKWWDGGISSDSSRMWPSHIWIKNWLPPGEWGCICPIMTTPVLVFLVVNDLEQSKTCF